MVYKLIKMLPLRRCECGGKAELHPYVSIGGSYKGYFVSCYRFACNRLAVKIYKNPLAAVIRWNLRDWNYTRLNNRYLKGVKKHGRGKNS